MPAYHAIQHCFVRSCRGIIETGHCSTQCPPGAQALFLFQLICTPAPTPEQTRSLHGRDPRAVDTLLYFPPPSARPSPSCTRAKRVSRASRDLHAVAVNNNRTDLPVSWNHIVMLRPSGNTRICRCSSPWVASSGSPLKSG